MADTRTYQDIGETSDGYHTFNELYAHRITLYIALCKKIKRNPDPSGMYVWRSELHSDGSKLEGWFVLGIHAEPGRQITYRLPLSRWDETDFAITRELAPEWDGHTSADVLKRIADL